MSRAILCVALLCLAASASAIHPLSSLNATAYLGRWYQVYDNLFSNIFYAQKSVCNTADYGINGPHNVSVYNALRFDTPNGVFGSITGYALQNEIKPAELTVYFPGAPTGAPYWAIKLGEAEYMDDPLCAPCYNYAVMSDEAGLSLYVLARDVDEFIANDNATVYEFLMQEGFTTEINKPVETYQGPDCPYPPMPEY